MTDTSTITTETRGHVLLIGLNRPQKLNAFNEEMLRALSRRLHPLRGRRRPALRRALRAGKDFTAGLDLASVMPGIEAGGPLLAVRGHRPAGDQRARAHQAARDRAARAGLHRRDRARARERHPPLLRRRHVRPARDRARHLPLRRGDVPGAGAARLGQRDALPAHRGAVRRGRGAAHRARAGGHVHASKLLEKAIAIAEKIAAQAPLGCPGHARLGARRARAKEKRPPPGRSRAQLAPLLASDDAREGVQSFLERRAGRYTGK